jgi:hypothetical protein
MKLADKGKIPQPSFFANSGRGAYAVWAIKPHESKFSDLLNYKVLNRALFREFKAYSALLEPDDVFDGSRVLRLPGSINSKAPHNPVGYVVQFDGEGKPYEYTLEGVAAKLRVELVEPKPSLPAPIAPPVTAIVAPTPLPVPSPAKTKPSRKYSDEARVGMSKGGKDGMRGLGLRRMAELIEIINFKGVFHGFRYKTLFILASTARIAGLEQAEAIATLEDLASRFTPPYPGTDANDIPVADIVSGAYKGYIKKHTATGLAKFFNLSTPDCRHLLLRTIYTEEILEIKNLPKRADITKIESAIFGEAPVSTCLLDLCQRLFAHHAISLSKSQVSRHVRRLGIRLGHSSIAVAA